MKIEDFQSVIEEMSLNNDADRNRDFVVRTGPKGAEIFQKAVELEFVKVTLKDSIERGTITLDEFMSLTAMAESEDHRDRVLVLSIIEAKEEQIKKDTQEIIKEVEKPTQKSNPKTYGTYLQRRRS